MNNIGRNLAELVFYRSSDKPIKEICLDLKLPEESIERFRFGILIINLAIAIWLVNKFSSIFIITKNIIDSIFDYCFKTFRIMNKSIQVSNIIVYKPELSYIVNEFLIEETTSTDLYTLFGMIQSYRMPRYVECIDKNAKRMLEPLSFWIRPLSQLFYMDFTGDEKAEPDLLISILLLDIFDNFMHYCKANLR